LENTSMLNQDLRQQLNVQINLVYQQFEHLDPAFPDKFNAINFELGEKQTRYLKLNIGPQERLTVERIKTLQSELGIQALQIYYLLQSNDRANAVLRLSDMKSFENKISREFPSLNDLETSKLREVQHQLNTSVTT